VGITAAGAGHGTEKGVRGRVQRAKITILVKDLDAPIRDDQHCDGPTVPMLSGE